MSQDHSKARKYAGRGLVLGALAGAAIAVGLLFAPAGGIVIAGVGLGKLVGAAIVGGLAGGFSGTIGGGILGSFFKEKNPHPEMNFVVPPRSPMPPVREMAPSAGYDMATGQPTVSHQTRIAQERMQPVDCAPKR